MLELPQRIRAVCRGGQLALTLREDVPAETVLCEGLNRWGSWEITLRRAAGHRVTVRPWQGRDRLETARGSRSVKRLFQDAGIPADRRDGYPVVCVDGVPCAAGGIRENLPPKKGGAIEIIINQREKCKEDTAKW